MKPVLVKTVKVFRLVFLIVGLAAAGLLMGEQSMTHQRNIEVKKALLEKENASLAMDIRSLERKITLLRTDPGTIERVAKSKLGMVRRGETVYIFTRRNQFIGPTISSEGLSQTDNEP